MTKLNQPTTATSYPPLSRRKYAHLARLQREHRIQRWGGMQVLPKTVHFADQNNQERILLVLRSHPVTLLIVALERAIVFLGLWGLMFLASTVVLQDINNQSFMIILTILLLGMYFSFLFYIYTIWFFNVFIITNQRLVSLHYPSLVIAKWSSAAIERIEDVSHTPRGIFSVFFDYGDVTVKTAGHETKFELKKIPKARDVQGVLTDLIQTKTHSMYRRH